MNLLITGGAGFIGSHFARLSVKKSYTVRVFDKLTYAGNMANLGDISECENFSFFRGDICNREQVEPHVRWADVVVNFAAETHVDRSIVKPADFIETDVIGTGTLLECCRNSEKKIKYLQISTDEVYGTISEGSFTESSPLIPRSPYSASKAGADLLVLSYHVTYGMPVLITRSSNNYGPCQYPEKLIPFFVTRALKGEYLPLYGDGLNVRDWLYVEDNCQAIMKVMEKGAEGQVYNIGGCCELQNIHVAGRIVEILGLKMDSIRYIEDRAGHDRRYSVDIKKIRELGWAPSTGFEEGLEKTVKWYVDNPGWWNKS